MDANCLIGAALTADGGWQIIVPDTPSSSGRMTDELQPDGLSFNVKLVSQNLLQT